LRIKSQRDTTFLLAQLLLLALLVAASSFHDISIAHARKGDRVAIPDDAVTVSVLGLFHPRELIVSATAGHALILQTGDESVVLENSTISSAIVRMDGTGLAVTSGRQELHATNVRVAGRGNEAEDFILEIRGKIKRRYHGTVEIRSSSSNLLAIVTLDLETAVASVVAAEAAPGTPPEALKAYAIAARSYFVAGGGRHHNFDFCDTTHCQFLRTPPLATSPAAKATEATRGLVLAYESTAFAAMYTRSCGGRTRTPVQVGLPAADYPYYSVDCEHCRRHPVRWTSNLSARDAGPLRPSDESSRLAVARHLGWSAVPSNDFSLTKEHDRILLAGVGNGHGIGLCQAGARAMAESGASFPEILQHYYPNTEIVQHSGPKRI
jgi:peptidoglycan hydrolase-like amidase